MALGRNPIVPEEWIDRMHTEDLWVVGIVVTLSLPALVLLATAVAMLLGED